jgi:hypothetical protein
MALDADAANALFSALESHAMSLGVFQRVNTHDSDSPPSTGLSCSITLGPMTASPNYSGLTAVTITINFIVIVYNPMQQKPLDGIDPAIIAAVSALLAAYAGDFTLGGLVRDVDVLALRSDPAYLDQDGTSYRVEQITLPIVYNDAFAIQESS